MFMVFPDNSSGEESSETQIPSPGREDPLEEEMATHSSIFAGKIPWTEEPGWLQSIESQKSWTRQHASTRACMHTSIPTVTTLAWSFEAKQVQESIGHEKPHDRYSWSLSIVNFQVTDSGLRLFFCWKLVCSVTSFLFPWEDARKAHGFWTQMP